MKTLNNVVLFVLVLFVAFGSMACGDSDNPTAPSSVSSTTMADAPPSFGPSTPVRTTPASFDADNLRPDARGWNAYDFTASWDGRMLRLVLVEDRMREMREASKPHRNRLITVGTCPVEPHHSLQACGDPIWQATMRLAGRLELDPIPLASCEGWIVVNAAELSDDKYDGWRNAPCPTADDDAVSSDGTGSGWPEYPPLPRPMADHSLPFSINDPTGDIQWQNCTAECTYEYDGGARRSERATDLTGLRLSDQDPDGWIRITFDLGAPFDLGAIAQAATTTPRFAFATARFLIGTHVFELRLYSFCRGMGGGICERRPIGTWEPYYGYALALASPYIRTVFGGVTGNSISFEINPPSDVRETSDTTAFVAVFRTWIDDRLVPTGDETYDVRSEDLIRGDLVLPGIP